MRCQQRARLLRRPTPRPVDEAISTRNGPRVLSRRTQRSSRADPSPLARVSTVTGGMAACCFVDEGPRRDRRLGSVQGQGPGSKPLGRDAHRRRTPPSRHRTPAGNPAPCRSRRRRPPTRTASRARAPGARCRGRARFSMSACAPSPAPRPARNGGIIDPALRQIEPHIDGRVALAVRQHGEHRDLTIVDLPGRPDHWRTTPRAIALFGEAASIADRRVGGRTAALAQDVPGARGGDDVVHREEVRRVVKVGDQREFVAQLSLHRLRRPVRIAVRQRCRGPAVPASAAGFGRDHRPRPDIGSEVPTG